MPHQIIKKKKKKKRWEGGRRGEIGGEKEKKHAKDAKYREMYYSKQRLSEARYMYSNDAQRGHMRQVVRNEKMK